jgi:hypothetical protein
VAAVTAKVNCDPVRSRLFAYDGGGDNAWLDGFSCLPYGGNVIDVDIKFGWHSDR